MDYQVQKQYYFNVEKFPTIHIRSNQIISGNKPGEFKMDASLTIKNITKKISIPFSVTNQNGKTLFLSNFEINRRDFRIGGNSISLSNTVKISLKVVVN